jgi:hypothetical protein
MSVINSVLLAVIGMAQATPRYAPITIGALPPDNGISCSIATGAPETTFLTKGMAYQFSLVMNAKHTSQQTASDTLNDIHQALTQATQYPATAEYQITSIETISTPSYLGREENKQYLYGSSLRVKFFYKKGA